MRSRILAWLSARLRASPSAEPRTHSAAAAASTDAPQEPEQTVRAPLAAAASDLQSIAQTLAALEDAALVIDATGRVALGNPSAAQLLQMDLTTQPNVLDFVASADRSELIEKLKAAPRHTATRPNWHPDAAPRRQTRVRRANSRPAHGCTHVRR